MTSLPETIGVLYVDPDGRICSGRWATVGSPESHGDNVLLDRTGESLGPSQVRALLAPRDPNDDQRAALWRAHRAGYQVE